VKCGLAALVLAGAGVDVKDLRHRVEIAVRETA
jgi:hypothetical protein